MSFLPGSPWLRVSKRDPRAVGLYKRHYSSKKNGKTSRELLAAGIVSPGESVTLLLFDGSALFVWNKQKGRRDGQGGVNCAVFRNEGSERSSDLILEAEAIAWEKWPGERLFSYVNPGEIGSHNPGYCFKLAGWNLVRDEKGKPYKSPGGLILLEKYPK